MASLIQNITTILQNHPELAVFLTLAIGFAIGRLKIGTFKIGAVLGTLFAGVLVGQLNIPISPVVKTIFFDLFLFSTGYKVGPQFFQGLKKNALPQLFLTLIICVSCLFTAFILARFLNYDVGTAAGLLAGAFSESTLIGTASESINRLDISDIEKARLINNIPVAYAATYLLGATSLVYYMTTIAPKLLRIDLKEESKKLSLSLTGETEEDPTTDTAFKRWIIRAYKVTNKKWIGLTIGEFEKMNSNLRIDIQRMRHEGKLIEPQTDTVIHEGDVMVIMAQHGIILNSLSIIGPEILDEELLNFPIGHMSITVTKKNVIGKTLGELARSENYRLMLDKVIREYHEIPFNYRTIIERGDVLKVTGKISELESAAKKTGYLDRLNIETDITFLSLGIVLGGFVGMLSINIFDIDVTLTPSGGALIMGLLFGWIHSQTPVLGRIPEAGLWIFDNVGLATFIGLVGLSAGPSFINSLFEIGLTIIPAGICVAILPHIIGLFFGRYILRMNPIILLGAQTGAGTSTLSLKSLQDASQSKYPVLGYTIPYAFGNILLTAWGPVLVGMMT